MDLYKAKLYSRSDMWYTDSKSMTFYDKKNKFVKLECSDLIVEKKRCGFVREIYTGYKFPTVYDDKFLHTLYYSKRFNTYYIELQDKLSLEELKKLNDSISLENKRKVTNKLNDILGYKNEYEYIDLKKEIKRKLKVLK